MDKEQQKRMADRAVRSLLARSEGYNKNPKTHQQMQDELNKHGLSSGIGRVK
jgi:hypothetical protein